MICASFSTCSKNGTFFHVLKKWNDPETATNVDINGSIRVIQQVGGTVDETELIDGLIFPKRGGNSNGPTRVENAKIGLIQFCLSAPKTDMENNV